MAAKTDPKDERIAELELQLEAANKATTNAEEKCQAIPAFQAEIEALKDSLKKRDAKVLELEGELTALKNATSDQRKATVTGLDPSKAVQLSVSSLVTNAVTKQPVTAVAGDMLALAEAFEDVSRKVGRSATVHPVTKDEIEAAKRAGRAY